MQINLSMENCWGIVRALVDVVAAMDDGKYLLVKCATSRANSRMCIARFAHSAEGRHVFPRAPWHLHYTHHAPCRATQTSLLRCS